jgi:SAM-dependent methyltransferase
MSGLEFQWSPEFWQGWRESENPYRKYKSDRDRQLVLKHLPLRDGDCVLEVGCGYGWISEALWSVARIDWTGIDQSDAMIERLAAAHPERAGRMLVADARRLPFPDHSFDKVLCTGVLMHIRRNLLAVHELVRVLRTGGALLCSINNALSPFSLPVQLWNSRKNGFVQKFQVPNAFRTRLREAGLRTGGAAGDGIIATVPLSLGKIQFPPPSLSSGVCKWDRWWTDRIPLLAYEVWFYGVKVDPQCAS